MTMPHGCEPAGSLDLDDFVEAFESARAADPNADFASFLPDTASALYPRVLAELARIDMEWHWERGQAKQPEEYRARYPILFESRDLLRSLAFEEYRLRRLAGEAPSPTEYQQRFGFPIGIPARPPAKGPDASAPDGQAARSHAEEVKP